MCWKQKIIDFIKTKMSETGLKQGEFGEMVGGRSQKSIGNIINLQQGVTLELAEKLVEVFGISPNELLGYSHTKKQGTTGNKIDLALKNKITELENVIKLQEIIINEKDERLKVYKELIPTTGTGET